MTTPANITLQVAVNGGAPQTGAIQVAYEDELVLSLVDPSGVKSVEYRIWEYPDGFTVPAGWASVTNEDGVTYYRYTAANGSAAPAITMPAASTGLWGKYFFSVEVNGRLRNGRTENDLFDDRTAAFIPSLSGIGDVGFGETTQFDSHRQWASVLKSLLRAMDAAIGGTLSTKTATHDSTGAAYETIASLTYTLPEGYYADVTLSATGHVGSEYAHYEKVARYTRLSGGSVVEDWNVDIYGSPKEIDNVWDARITFSGNDIQSQVKANSDNPAWRVTRVITVHALP